MCYSLRIGNHSSSTSTQPPGQHPDQSEKIKSNSCRANTLGRARLLSRLTPSFTLDPSFHAGAYYVQDASSLFLEQAVNISLDLSQPFACWICVPPPGGKSTHFLSLISADSFAWSPTSDWFPRNHPSSENIQKWGTPMSW